MLTVCRDIGGWIIAVRSSGGTTREGELTMSLSTALARAVYRSTRPPRLVDRVFETVTSARRRSRIIQVGTTLSIAGGLRRLLYARHPEGFGERALDEKRTVVGVAAELELETAAHFLDREGAIYEIVEHPRLHHPEMLAGPVGDIPIDLLCRGRLRETAVAFDVRDRDIGKAGRLQRLRNQSQERFRL